MNKLAYILELIWLGLALFCIGVGIYATIKTGFSASYMFFILSVFAVLMYYIRRRRRLSSEK